MSMTDTWKPPPKLASGKSVAVGKAQELLARLPVRS
jgi:hypothetical protein